MLDIVWKIDVAQRCFKDWESEQDTTIPKYHVQVEAFYIYRELEGFKRGGSSLYSLLRAR